MRSYVEWLDECEFCIREDWSDSGGWVGSGKLKLQPIQRRILKHALTPDSGGKFPYKTVVYSCVKKSGKTTLLASFGAWGFEEAPDYSEIYCIANDQEQAQARAYTDIRYHLHRRDVHTYKYYTENPETGTKIDAVAKDPKGAAGSRPFMTLWDELWAYESERGYIMWSEMQPPPTLKSPLRIIATYAGFSGKSKLLWDLYERNFVNGEPVPELEDIVDDRGNPVCRARGDVFVYWDTVPRMPWQTTEFYESAANTERPMDYLRLHCNQWVTSEEEFIPIKYWDRAAEKMDSPLLYGQSSKYCQFPISIGVDGSWKHDETAVVGTFYDPVDGFVGQAFHRIWKPGTTGLDLEETVEAYIMAMSAAFKIAMIIYDPRQLHRSMTTLSKRGLPTMEMPQTSGNMQKATMNLYDLLINERFYTYPNDECRERMQFAIVENKKGVLRLIKDSGHTVPNDFVVALAMSAWDAVNRGGTDTTQDIRIESPYGDQTQMRVSNRRIQEERRMPAALRTVGNRKETPENFYPTLDLGAFRKDRDDNFDIG